MENVYLRLVVGRGKRFANIRISARWSTRNVANFLWFLPVVRQAAEVKKTAELGTQIYNFHDMADDATLFYSAIEPFRDLWQKIRISAAIVLRDGHWISLATRIALSHSASEAEFFIQPVPNFVSFSLDASLSTLDSLLQGLGSKGSFSIEVDGRGFEVFLTFAHAKCDSNRPPIGLGTPISTLIRSHEGGLQYGESQFRLSNFSVESQPRLIDYDQLNAVSSRLRMHVPPFSGVTELLTFLEAPFDRSQNQTCCEIVAPLPFSMTCSEKTVTVLGPQAVLRELKVVGFFDTGRAPAELTPVERTEPSGLATIMGSIPWPEKSRSGKLFLYFRDHEAGSVSVRRWVETTSWRIQVEDFFDPGRKILKKGLESRGEQTELEISVVRLLNQLRVPTVWYGNRQYQDCPDLAVCLEVDNEWIVLLGECTVQKPSVKFTPLLTRKAQLDKLFNGDVQIRPVVFTCSTLSSADKEQARQDGIALVGAVELAKLLQGVDQEWGAEELIRFLDELMAEPPDFLDRWSSRFSR